MTSAPRRSSHLAVTVNDVARLAGVSAMTVSRVLNQPDKVPPATVAKVQAAVTQSGYVPNRIAGGLRSSRSRLIAAVVPTLSGPVFLDTIEALTAALERRGYHLIVGQSGYSETREAELLSDLISRRPDGIVLTGVAHTDEGRRRLLASGIPVVETWDLTAEPIDMLIGFSHEAVGRAVCRHHAARGRRRLALIAADDPRSQRRARAYVDEAAAQGLAAPAARFVAAPARLGDGRRALADLLAQQPGIDALFCSSDLLALGAITEARRRGVAIPQQLAVMGFGDLQFARDLDPALSTVRIDGPRIGELAAAQIVARANGDTVAVRIVDVGFSIVERDSG